MVPGKKVVMGGRLGEIFVFLYFVFFLGGVKSDQNGKVFLKKLGSGLGLRSCR